MELHSLNGMERDKAPPADPGVWLQAHGAFASALADFQITSPQVSEMTLSAVLAAMKPAFALGFSYTARWANEGLNVTLHHASGWDVDCWCGEPSDEQLTLAEALAQMLGIMQVADAGNVQDAHPEPVACPAPQPDPRPQPKPEPEPEPEHVDLMGEGSPDHPVDPADLKQLSAGDKKTCVALIKALKPDERSSFAIAFRSHFNVPDTEKTVVGFITQVQHQRFIQNFVDELELQGVAA
jgi:hypothetical protein